MTREETVEKVKKVLQNLQKGDYIAEKIADALEEPEEVGMWGKFWNDDGITIFGKLEAISNRSGNDFFYKSSNLWYFHFREIPGLKEFMEKAGEA